MPGDRYRDSTILFYRAGRIGLLVATGMLAAGCGSDQPTVVPVDGVVRIDGQPLRTGTVRFIPAAGRSARGQIQSDGSFRLGTYREADGAQVGMSRVAITAFEVPAGNVNPDVDRPRSKSLIPLRYNSTANSGLTFEVKPSGTNHAEFDLTSDN
jgi:hypothetical protein